MTNSPNEPPETNHDLQPEDLKLTPEKRTHRDQIAPEPTSADNPTVLTPSVSRRHKKKKHPLRTALLIVLMSLLGIVVVAGGTLLVLQNNGRKALLTSQEVTLTAPDAVIDNNEVEISDNGKIVVYNGQRYTFNEHRTNFLCIGVDKTAMGLDGNTVGTGGQADTLLLVSVDTSTSQIDALAISRDSMVDIDLYTADGTFYGVENTQICLSYAYGDGRETSCENTIGAVSRLMYGIPINTYAAIDLSCIATLNDAVGGVELQLLSDFRRTDGSWCNTGEVITLHGEEAERYVRERDISQLASNNERMERQKQYLLTFFEQAFAATKQNLKVPLSLYDAVADDSITNLSASKITYLATALVRHNASLTITQVPGTVIQSPDDGYAEYIVDEQALYELILEIFYTKV